MGRGWEGERGLRGDWKHVFVEDQMEWEEGGGRQAEGKTLSPEVLVPTPTRSAAWLTGPCRRPQASGRLGSGVRPLRNSFLSFRPKSKSVALGG